MMTLSKTLLVAILRLFGLILVTSGGEDSAFKQNKAL